MNTPAWFSERRKLDGKSLSRVNKGKDMSNSLVLESSLLAIALCLSLNVPKLNAQTNASEPDRGSKAGTVRNSPQGFHAADLHASHP